MEGTPASSYIKYPCEIKYNYRKGQKYSINSDLFQTSFRQGHYTTVNNDMHETTITQFVNKIVKSVKNKTNDNNTMEVSTGRFNFGQNWMGISARALYHQHGIKITHVDSLEKVEKLIVEIPKDVPSKADPFFQKARENGYFTDFAFTIKDSGQRFECHQLILCSKSSFFEKLLTGGFQETGSNEIAVPDGIEPETVERMLSFLYTGEIQVKNLSKEETIELLTLSKFYGFQYLSQVCTDHLRDLIDENNVAELLDVADRLDVEDLTSGCEKFLIENLEDDVECIYALAKKFQLLSLVSKCEELKPALQDHSS